MSSSKTAPVTPENHSDWVPLLELAAREVFELMLSCHLTVPASAPDASLGITSMVGLAGQLCGVLSIRCDRKSATLMASKMLGVNPENVGPELSDALGEVCNMVAGNFKNKIPGLSEGCMLSPPTVITGNDYDLHPLADSAALQLWLLFEDSPIVISLQIHN